MPVRWWVFRNTKTMNDGDDEGGCQRCSICDHSLEQVVEYIETKSKSQEVGCSSYEENQTQGKREIKIKYVNNLYITFSP